MPCRYRSVRVVAICNDFEGQTGVWANASATSAYGDKVAGPVAYHTSRTDCRDLPSIRTTSNARLPSPFHEAPSVGSSIEMVAEATLPEEHLDHRSCRRIIGRRVARACGEVCHKRSV